MKYILENITTHLQTECLQIKYKGFNRYYANEDNGIFKLNDLVASEDPEEVGGRVINEAEAAFVEVYINPYSKDKKVRGTLGYNYFEKGYLLSNQKNNCSNKDMVDFAEWCEKNYFYSTVEKKWSTEFNIYEGILYTTKQLLEIWQNKKTVKIYYK